MIELLVLHWPDLLLTTIAALVLFVTLVELWPLIVVACVVRLLPPPAGRQQQ